MSVTTENSKIPSKIDFNESMVTGPAAPQYVDALYHGVIVATAQETCPWDKSGDLGLGMRLRAVDASGRPTGPTVKYWVGIPVANPAVPGHFVSKELKEVKMGNGSTRYTSDYEDYIKDCRELIAAVGKGDILPKPPKKKEGSDDVYVDPETGDTMSQQEQRARYTAIARAALVQMLEWFNQASDDVADANKELLNATLFFKTYTNKRGYANVGYVTDNRRGDEVRTSDFTTASTAENN